MMMAALQLGNLMQLEMVKFSLLTIRRSSTEETNVYPKGLTGSDFVPGVGIRAISDFIPKMEKSK